MAALVVAGSLVLIRSLIKWAIVAYGVHKLGEWALPGNEAKLMAAMKKLKLKKGSAEAQFLKELTLQETVKIQEEFKKSMATGDPTATNNMMHSIMSQSTSSDRTTPIGGSPISPEGVPGRTAPLTDRPVLRGNRQDVAGMQAAVQSLRDKTANHDHIPAALRLTGRPTHG